MSRTTSETLKVVWRVGAGLALALGVAGCAETLGAEPVYFESQTPAIQAEVVPYDLEAYPRYWYGNTWNYLVDGRWYYRTPRAIMIYRAEPPSLNYERRRLYAAPPNRVSAPPAPRYYRPYYRPY